MSRCPHKSWALRRSSLTTGARRPHALRLRLAQTYPMHTVPLLCTYHLAKNFFKHVHPVIRDQAEWRKLNSWFWHFAKFSDNRFDVDLEWEKFLEKFDEVAQGPSSGNARLWLESRRRRVARRAS